MILITGANGHLGSKTIDNLLKKDLSADIAGLVRSEEKGAGLKEKGVEVRIGDYRDQDSLRKAMEGVDVLLFISSSTIEGRVGQHENVVEAARESEVGQLFYTSMVQADKRLSPLTIDHADTEEIIKDSGLPYSILRHTFYTEFLPLFLGDALETGEWTFPSNGQKINLAYRSEMAEVLANGVAEPERHTNNTYEITSSSAYTLEELADMLSEASGKEITYNDMAIQDFEETLQQAGLPEEQLAMSVITATTFANGALDYTFEDMGQLLGREPADVSTFIRELVNG